MIRTLLATALLATPAAADIKVATTFTVIADMAREVGGEHAEVASITRPGAEVHGYSPTPRDILDVQDADLILYNGMNLELWFDRFFRNLRDVPAVEVSEGIEPISISGGSYDGRPNPHAWMGLEGARVYVDNIAEAFAEADPENAEYYRANAAAYVDEIEETVGEAVDAIAALPEGRRWLVTSEGAFSYLARDLGLNEAFIWPINADQQGSPSQMRAVIDTVRANDVPAVFSESTVPPEPAFQVARETGAEYGGILYVDSLSEADGPVPTYLDLLRVTIGTIAGGLSE
ncbi:manganese/iron transport system substrate-binding protein [Hasllibacter halocynthiae]|uniref:Manganese/iron transport system substrate-binding protein n=1 Tax=Hasllibacter halocynthiae TaxID=595589 RepID=A0A2T0X935_9RHOB|nr:metal ABC transporter substrate-binding protein [Hasllibacter halocynthiae]PRY95443.1 manganese/iron transport system substrate-binding protein [Hasllibacter halocynthiae]